MGKKASLIVLTVLIILAVFFGLMLISHGDGPITGIVMSSNEIKDLSEYKTAEGSHEAGTILVISNEFNKYKEKYKSAVGSGSNVYANVHLVECSKGTKLTAKWIYSGSTIKEEIKELTTDREGIISFLLDSSSVKRGDYALQIFYDGKKAFEQSFSVE